MSANSHAQVQSRHSQAKSSIQRDGCFKEMPAAEIVPGDGLALSAGALAC